MKTYYKHGSWNGVCDVCGFYFKADKLRKRWDGFMVCDKDFEFRNPQEFIKIPKDDPSPPWQRPDSSIQGVYGGCNFANSVGIVGVGVVGCTLVGRATIWGN